jgi:hypothetical protein
MVAKVVAGRHSSSSSGIPSTWLASRAFSAVSGFGLGFSHGREKICEVTIVGNSVDLSPSFDHSINLHHFELAKTTDYANSRSLTLEILSSEILPDVGHFGKYFEPKCNSWHRCMSDTIE